MNIAYIGNFTQPHCTEVHLAASLEQLDHVVTRIQENGFSPDDLIDHFRRHKYDLFLYTRTWGNFVTLELLDMLKSQGVPTASYHLDLYVPLERGANLSRNDPFWATSSVFTPDGDPDSAKVFKSRGINHHYSPPGIYEPECNLMLEETVKTRGNDVIFVGGGAPTGQEHQYGHLNWPYRGQLLEFLETTYGDRYSKYGFPQETVRNHALNQLYANSKVTVGDTLCPNFTHKSYTSDRLVDSVSRGAFLIYPWIDGVANVMFDDKKEVVFYKYGDFDQLKSLIDYYLDPVHDAERIQIRNAGMKRAKEEHTYRHRMQTMLDVLRREGVLK